MTIQFTDLDKKFGLPTGTLHSVWEQESTFGANWVSPAGARGHFGFMPATRGEVMAKLHLDPWSKDPRVAATCCGYYLKGLLDRFDGNMQQALSAYNAGGGRVSKAIRKNGENWLKSLKPETQAYAKEILERIGYEDRLAYQDQKDSKQGTTKEQDEKELQARTRILEEFGMSKDLIKSMGDTVLGKLFFSVLEALLDLFISKKEVEKENPPLASAAQKPLATDLQPADHNNIQVPQTPKPKVTADRKIEGSYIVSR